MFGSQIFLKMLIVLVLKIIMGLFRFVFLSSLFGDLFSLKKINWIEIGRSYLNITSL